MEKLRIVSILLLTVFGSIFLINGLNGQDTYTTNHGTIAIKTSINNANITLVSNDLNLLLNYKTADVTFNTALNNFSADKPVTDTSILSGELKFEGSLGIEYINTTEHPKQNFNTEGVLKKGDNNIQISGSGTLEHLYSRQKIACLLSLKYNINQENAMKIFPKSDITSGVHIEIIYAVLDKTFNENKVHGF